jgi:5,6-dimethylbenzimidazole synthase
VIGNGAGDPAGLDAGAGGQGPGAGLYETVNRRRDVRGQFTGDSIPQEALGRMLAAAHAAPSVGLSQPWDFVLVADPEKRRAFYDHVQEERTVFAATLSGAEAERFAGIKIDGILEASLSVVVTYDPARGAPNVLGRHAIADAGLYSVCLAIQNFWLAATAEGMGVGWVSFYREAFLSDLLGLPPSIRPVAWLCVGPVSHLEAVPDLERHGWRARLPLDAVLHYDSWGQRSEVAPLHPSRSGAG